MKTLDKGDQVVVIGDVATRATGVVLGEGDPDFDKYGVGVFDYLLKIDDTEPMFDVLRVHAAEVQAIKPKKSRCDYMLQGPKVGRRVVLWQRHCLRPATVGTDRCWQHQGWTNGRRIA